MLLSIANSLGLIGTTAYFYKQLEAVRLDMVKLSQTLTGVLRKVAEMEKGDQHRSEALHALNDQVKKINDQLEEFPSLDMTDNMELDLTEIIAVLEDNNIQVDRPSQQSTRSRRSGDRRAPPRRNESESDDRREMRRPTRLQSSRDFDSRSRPSTRDQSRESTRDAPRSTQIPRVEPASSSYVDEDAELIGEVRRQQPTRVT